MTEASKMPDLEVWFKQWVYDLLGIPGLVAVSLVLAAWYAYRNWNKVSKWPGVAHVVTYFNRWPIPRADPDRFCVIVAQLENDAKGEHHRLIVEALKEFKGVKTFPLNWAIPVEDRDPEVAEKRGHDTARGYLKESGASVVIWGTVLHMGSDSILKLYWTVSYEAEREPQRHDSPRVETQFQLPELFWSELSDILRLLVESSAAEFETAQGHYVADRLHPFISRVRALLNASEGRPEWDDGARGRTRVVLANGLALFGEQSGKTEPLIEAVAAYRQALEELTRERVPLDWAMTQNNLGAALRSLGERESGTSRLEEAVAAFREALKERTRERVPLAWGKTQTNLGGTLSRLGERESGTESLQQAVAAYKSALEVFESAQAGYYIEMTKANLARAENLLQERQK